MAGRSPVTTTEDQKAELKVLAQGADRAEADRAHALLLTLDGWTSARIAQAFGVREDKRTTAKTEQGGQAKSKRIPGSAMSTRIGECARSGLSLGRVRNSIMARCWCVIFAVP